MQQTASGSTAQTAMPYYESSRDNFNPRNHYRPMWEHIRRTGQRELAAKAHEAHLAMHTDGVTFTVYSDEDEAIERVWPFDLISRVITAEEWSQIEAHGDYTLPAW